MTGHWSEPSTGSLEGSLRPLASTHRYTHTDTHTGLKSHPPPAPRLLLRGSPRLPPAQGHIFFCHFTDAMRLCTDPQTLRCPGSGIFAWATCWHRGWAVGKGKKGVPGPLGVTEQRGPVQLQMAHAYGHLLRALDSRQKKPRVSEHRSRGPQRW